MTKTRTFSLLQRVLAFALAFVMVCGYVPFTASADNVEPITTVADPETLTRPETIYGDNTENAGKITVGKSVSDTSVTLGSTTVTPATDNFHVTISQSAQVMGLSTETAVPLDVVFVLDTSGSMNEGGNSPDRASKLVTAANSAISTLMASNENNRIGVVAFSGKGYGGGTSNGAAANVLSDLKHYTGTAATNHLTWTYSWVGSGYDAEYVGFINGRNTISGTTANRRGYNGGTNIQAGIALGAKMLLDNTDTTVTYDDGTTVTRIPVLIVISDGCPTLVSSDSTWYNPSQTSDQKGYGYGAYEGNGFLSVLTAAYYKGAITEHYYGTAASNDNRCLVYTVGVDIGSLSDDDEEPLARITLDPATYAAGTYLDSSTTTNNYYRYGRSWKNNNKSETNSFKTYWSKYLNYANNANAAGSGFNIRTHSDETYTVTKASVTATKNYVQGKSSTGATMYTSGTGLAYNDRFFDAANNNLNDVFSTLVSEIQMKAISSPTHVSTTPEFSGYITFTDPIGEFMEVKDMKGLYLNGNLYAPAAISSVDTETLEEVLETRLTMTSSQNVSDMVDALIASASGSSITWWGNNYSTDGSSVRCLGVAADDSVDYIKTASIPSGANVVCRSYFFYGSTGTGSDPSDLLYFVVRVQRELTAPYKQTVVISAPASLLSVDEVLITKNSDGTYTATVSDAETARVIYEVGLRGDITPQNVDQVVASEMSAYTSETVTRNDVTSYVNYDAASGTYHFYTNDWHRDAELDEDHDSDAHHRAMAQATFNAASDNPFYVYQADTLILNEDGTPYTGSKPSGTYYYERVYYDWSGSTQNSDGSYNATQKTTLIKVSLSADSESVYESDGKWYIKKGTYTASSLVVNGDDTEKTSNNTNTAEIVAHPHRTNTENDNHYTVLLGNNGKLSIVSDPPKSVHTTDLTISANGEAVMVGQELTYKIKVVNNETATAGATVTDYIPTGTTYVENSADNGGVLKTDANGKQYVEWNLTGLAAGETVTVSFKVKVSIDAITGSNAVTTIDNTATIQIGNNPAYTTNTTSNPPEGKTSSAADNNGNAYESGTTLKVGDQLTYTIRYFNDETAASDVTITDVIPAGTTFSSATENGTYDSATNTVSWVIRNVPAGTGGTVSFVVFVNASAKVQPDAATQPGEGTIELNNTAKIQIGENGPTVDTNTTTDEAGVGDISITKQITDTTDAERFKDKEFTLILSEAANRLSGTYKVYVDGSESGTVTFAAGIGTVKIKHGQTVVIKGLPRGATIAVTEDMTGLDGWKDSYNQNKGSVVVSDSTGSTTTADVTVTNDFNTVAVNFQLSGVKNFAGTFPDGTYTFGFKATQCDGSGNVIEGGRVVTANATKGSGNDPVTFSFSSREFSEPTTLYYLITEDAPSNIGVFGDDTVYMLKLVVDYESATSANLVAKTYYRVGTSGEWTEFDWTKSNPIQFTNTYPAPASVDITGTKQLTGRYINNGEFSFELLDENMNVISNTSVTADGTSNRALFTFPRTYKITDMIVNGVLQNERTFTYYIREVDNKLDGVEYDPSLYQVVVTVELNDENELEATVTSITKDGDAASLTFTNKFEPTETSIHLYADKSLTGEGAYTLKGGEFSFSVYEADSSFNITNTSAVAGNSNAADGSVDLGIIEYELSDLRDSNGNYVTRTFYYVVKENIPATDGPTYDPNVIYSTAEYHVTVEVKVVEDEMVATVTGATAVTGTEDSYNVGTFENSRVKDETDFTPEAAKSTAATGDSTLPGGLSFSFNVQSATVDDNGNVTISTGNPAATGISAPTTAGDGKDKAVTFSKLVFTSEMLGTDSSKDFYYVIGESNTAATNGVTYDTDKFVLKVTLSRNSETKELSADGTYYELNEDNTIGIQLPENSLPTFTNTYNADASLNLTAAKSLTGGRTLNKGEFDFKLQRLQYNEGTQTYSIVADRVIDGINGYGDTAATVVTFGTLNYTANEAQLAQLEKVTIAEDETAGTAAREYWLVRYLMSEIKPDTNPLAGITYDSSQYIVTVKLEWVDNQFTAELFQVNKAASGYTLGDVVTENPAGGNTGVTFTNSYAPVGKASATITASKTLTGRDIRDGEFTFSLYRVDGDKEHLAATATNVGETVTFTREYSNSVLSSAGFDANGEYAVIYHLVENAPTTGGVSKVSGEYYVKVIITHDTTTASYSVKSVTYYTDKACEKAVAADQVEFVNKYQPAGTSFTPVATKELLDKDNKKLAITENQFSFTVQEINADGTVKNVNAGTGNSGKADAGSTSAVSFTPIAITTKGPHYFEISEVSGADATVTYTPAKYYVKVNVTDDSNGKLNVGTVTYYSDLWTTEIKTTDVLFTNHKSTGEVNVNLSLNIDKTVHILNSEGEKVDTYALAGDEFDFYVYKYDPTAADNLGDPVASGSNGKATNGVADITFSNFTVTLADMGDADEKTFQYIVKEVRIDSASTNAAATIDPNSIIVTVTVQKDEYKNLTVTNVTYEKSGKVSTENDNLFVNTFQYTKATLPLSGTKSLNGKELAAGEFTFELVDSDGKVVQTKTNAAPAAGQNVGTVTFDDLEFIQPGEYVYTVREQTKDKPANGTYYTDPTIFTVVVTVTSDATGQLHAVPMYYMTDGANDQTTVGGITFTNLYTPDPAALDLNTAMELKKTIVSETGAVLDLALDGFHFDLVGHLDADGKAITGTTDENGIIRFKELTFREATTYTFYIRESEDQDKAGYEIDPNAWMVEVKVSYNGTLEDITYTNVKGEEATAASGQLYIEKSSVTVKQMTGALAEDDDATTTGTDTTPTATFTNTYKPTGTKVTITADKVLTGRDLAAGEFNFRLKSEDGKLIVAEATNDANGNVSFEVSYSGSDMSGAKNGSKTFNYQIVEVQPAGAENDKLNGIAYDTTVGSVSVTVTDKDGALTVENSVIGSGVTIRNDYTAADAEAVITATKNLIGLNLSEGMFKFELEDSEGNKLDATNKADGSITFEPITYTFADMVDENGGRVTQKVYTYTLREVPVTRAVGMEYDETEYPVTVTVTDDLKGSLHAVVTYGEEDTSLAPVFTNTYTGNGAAVAFSAKKTLETNSSRTLKAGEFSFQLVDADGKVLETKTNDEKGNVSFTGIIFESAGTFRYTLREVPGNELGMTYDETVYDVTVEVVLNLDTGDYEATVTYSTGDGNAPEFVNEFEPVPVQVTLEATKKLTGRKLKDGEFQFRLYNEDGKKVATATNDAAGKITFDAQSFTEAGVYKFTMDEVRGLNWYVTYDKNEYQVVVTVTETDGVLTAEVTYPSKDGITFRNVYDDTSVIPQTGDGAPLFLLTMVMLLSAIGIVVLLILAGRRNRKGKYSHK